MWDNLEKLPVWKKHIEFVENIKTTLALDLSTPTKYIIRDAFSNKNFKVELWKNMKKKAIALKNLHKFNEKLDSLNHLTSYYFSDSIKSLKIHDSVAFSSKLNQIDSTIKIYNSLFAQNNNSKKSKKEKDRYVKGKKAAFVKDIKNTYNSSILFFFPPRMEERIKEKIFNDYQIEEDDTNYTLEQLKSKAEAGIVSINQFLEEQIIKLPTVSIPLAMKLGIWFVFPLEIFASIYLCLLYLNFLVIESRILHLKNKDLISVPSLPNIIETLKLPWFSNRKFKKVIGCFINIVVPIGITLLLGYITKNLLPSIYFPIVLGIYIILGSYIFYNRVKLKIAFSKQNHRSPSSKV